MNSGNSRNFNGKSPTKLTKKYQLQKWPNYPSCPKFQNSKTSMTDFSILGKLSLTANKTSSKSMTTSTYNKTSHKLLLSLSHQASGFH